MEGYKPEQQGEIMDDSIKEFVQSLSDEINISLPVTENDGTYEIDVNEFMLTFTLDDSVLEIRNIDVHGNEGLGSLLVEHISEFSEKYDLELVASNVVDSARGFWEKQDFQESENDGEYYKAA